MAANFAAIAIRFMAESERTNFQRPVKHAADTVGRLWIMIAGNPDPLAPPLQRTQITAIVVTQAARAAAVMETVAERHNTAWCIVSSQMRQARECRSRIVRRQQLATRGKA